MAGEASFGRADDFIDADYVVVSPDSREEATHAPISETFSSRSGMDMLRNRTFVEARDPSRAGFLFWGSGLAVAFAAFWIAGGHTLLNQTSPSSTIKPATQMRIAGWNSKISETGTNPTLLIDGEVVNDGSKSELLRPLEIEIASANGTRTRYKLGTGDTSIDPQGTFPFSGRLHLPKDGVKTVSVSFVH